MYVHTAETDESIRSLGNLLDHLQATSYFDVCLVPANVPAAQSNYGEPWMGAYRSLVYYFAATEDAAIVPR